MQSSAKKVVLLSAAFMVTVLAVLKLFGDMVPTTSLRNEVAAITSVSWFETEYFYLYVNIFVWAFPLLLSFDSKVHFYKKWPAVGAAISITAMLFIPWDLVFTGNSVWGFNSGYFLMQFSLLGLPIEEWLFFFTVPYACIFIYECLNYYVRSNWFGRTEPAVSVMLVALLVLLAIVFWQHTYTVVVSLFCIAYILFTLVLTNSFYRNRYYMAFLVSIVPFVLINGALTGAFTHAPVVLYNDEFNMGIRFMTIPLDDVLYAFLLLGLNITLFEKFVRRRHPAIKN